jgi:hypothetical protein
MEYDNNHFIIASRAYSLHLTQCLYSLPTSAYQIVNILGVYNIYSPS